MYQYLIHIIYRYLPNTPRYVSEKYLEIKFYLKKKNCRFFSDTSGAWDTWSFYYFWDICNWVSNDVFFLGYIYHICNRLIVTFFIINITYIYIYFGSLCLFENADIVDCRVKAILLLYLIVVLCLFGLNFAPIFFIFFAFEFLFVGCILSFVVQL